MGELRKNETPVVLQQGLEAARLTAGAERSLIDTPPHTNATNEALTLSGGPRSDLSVIRGDRALSRHVVPVGRCQVAGGGGRVAGRARAGEQAAGRGRVNFLPTVSKAQSARSLHEDRSDAGDRFQQPAERPAGAVSVRPAVLCEQSAARLPASEILPPPRGSRHYYEHLSAGQQHEGGRRKTDRRTAHAGPAGPGTSRVKGEGCRKRGARECAATAANIEKGMDPGQAGHGARRGRRTFAELVTTGFDLQPGRDRRSASTNKPSGTAG